MNDNYIMDLNAESDVENTAPVCEHEYDNRVDTDCNVCGTVREVSNVDNFVYTLGVMAKGMLGIFIVTAVIIATIIALNRSTSPKKKPSDDGDQQ